MKRNIMMLTAIALSAAALTGCGGGANEVTTGSSDPTVTYITYKVSGDDQKANSIRYTDGSGSTSQDIGARIPWTMKVHASKGVVAYQVMAQSDGGGEITCEILVDGKVVKTHTSNGQYALAACEYQP